MNDFADLVTEDRRRVILAELARAADYTANSVVLGDLLARQGHRVSRDRLRADLAWLEEQDLVLTQQPGGVWVVTLTARGYDVAQGVARVPGVARPRPE